MNNPLGKNYSLLSLFAFALPNMIMMIFLSLYTIVDGAFVSRFVGTTALSAVNMVYPAASVIMAIGIMIATGIGYSLSAVVGLIYFGFFRKKYLYFVKPKSEEKLLIRTCANGSSEMVTNLANAVTTFLFNYIFLKYYGEDGVAAITIVLYLEFVFTAIFFGYSNGIAPIVSFKYGQKNIAQLKKIFKSSLIIVVAFGFLGFVFSRIVISDILMIFTPYKNNVYYISLYGFRRYAFALLFMGMNIFASAWFTALSNGKVSAIISFARTFLFLAGTILVLPAIVGAVGCWLAVPCAEVLGIVVSIYYLKKLKKDYNY